MGQFCEKYGAPGKGFGVIPDWNPGMSFFFSFFFFTISIDHSVYYDPSSIPLPFFVPNTSTVQQDMANEYTATNRMDQGNQPHGEEVLYMANETRGIGLIMKELEDAGQ